MRIYVLRHGIAHDREDPDCPPDPQRALTARGITRTRQAAAGLAALGVEPQQVWTSPYLRARQTAALAAEALGTGARRLVRSDALLPGGSTLEAAAALRKSGLEQVMVVGHAPHLDLLIGTLLGLGDDAAPTALKKAGCACVLLDEEHGAILTWVMEPRALRRLAARRGRRR